MQVTRDTILDMIRARADEQGALERAEQVLPESFDTSDYLGELEKLGINPDDLQSEGFGAFLDVEGTDGRREDPEDGAAAP